MASIQEELSPETRQAQFEQGVAISLHLWLSLTVAVQNGLGGADSEDKRDWFAGAISDMFPSFVDLAKLSQTQPEKKAPKEPDVEDVEATLLQVMWDEFETNVDDDSEVEVVERIFKVRAQCAAGNFGFVEELRSRWLATKGKKVEVQVDTKDQDTDWESDDDEDEEDEDVDMDEAPALVAAPKEKPPPEVDEDGFTKVTRKKR
ncbi:Pre-rRNA-processing protein TSR2-domain-containing protein [Hypoxylon trugodes]|uniref:Pre-rRNA-processing protein TSR2-domain-containing protein n=1 Tax=Hypoxylon trugodes TaxID=326681 RepID=UPI00219A1FEB|nr:Pre-rRNA-processing protein TSR2-domain-containing protein [Hypoxylon trugodes]KAI1387259.1 Pre-rRNA-processing protein TSR2-domain-containing protein [Hypoxylon trugodes]